MIFKKGDTVLTRCGSGFFLREDNNTPGIADCLIVADLHKEVIFVERTPLELWKYFRSGSYRWEQALMWKKNLVHTRKTLTECID